ncbi:hypothetical protein NX059_003186 [Plenodomus lindquistii]|nr:hypothetical protein NX059_003186 [Plenodomus lindquistii]
MKLVTSILMAFAVSAQASQCNGGWGLPSGASCPESYASKERKIQVVIPCPYSAETTPNTREASGQQGNAQASQIQMGYTSDPNVATPE